MATREELKAAMKVQTQLKRLDSWHAKRQEALEDWYQQRRRELLASLPENIQDLVEES